MDRDTITAALAKPLDRALVKPPPKGKYGEYIGAFDVFNTANAIFGWDGWSYRVDKIEMTNRDQDEDAEKKFHIGWMALVTVTIPERGGSAFASKQDVGHGQGHGRSLGDAHESAQKEAVTDGIKRALRSFGHPLGLALYDKTQQHVSDDPDYDPKSVADRLLEALKHTADCDLSKWKSANKDELDRLKSDAPLHFEAVLDACKGRAKQNETEEKNK